MQLPTDYGDYTRQRFVCIQQRLQDPCLPIPLVLRPLWLVGIT